ncbi:hypothetical protein [Microbacterium sp. No. 7]|uniref:hypothetical protein n=1 Tax=Microbacterium sp. No. 7 TaxID=1714373 RepID=UPI0006CF7E35|nr:hypothetical protein [Microbacterium sp. No. 7]ALJ19037.1 hypothetical protein AOA12_03585 [Microbacterium sp. No. 7]
MTSTDNTAIHSGEETAAIRPQRRVVLKGAAWSLPVIAAAVSVPLASATTDTGVVALTIASGSALSIGGPNEAGTSVSGSFGASVSVSNTKSTAVNINSLSAAYAVEGPVNYEDLLYNGAPITGSTLTTPGGFTWAVLVNTGGYVELQLMSPLPVSVEPNSSVTVEFPELTFADTLTQSAAWLPLGRRVRATLTVNAFTDAGGLNDVSGKSYPANQ